MRAIVLPVLFGIVLCGLTACGGAKSSKGNAAASPPAASAPMESAPMESAAAAPNCGAVQAVWVNLKTKVYHQPGDPVYGKTKHGEFLCPSAAKAQGFRPSGGSASHHAKVSSPTN